MCMCLCFVCLLASRRDCVPPAYTMRSHRIGTQMTWAQQRWIDEPENWIREETFFICIFLFLSLILCLVHVAVALFVLWNCLPASCYYTAIFLCFLFVFFFKSSTLNSENVDCMTCICILVCIISNLIIVRVRVCAAHCSCVRVDENIRTRSPQIPMCSLCALASPIVFIFSVPFLSFSHNFYPIFFFFIFCYLLYRSSVKTLKSHLMWWILAW